MNKNIFAGIGSRETPFPIMRQMSDLSFYLTSTRGWLLRSGGAPGADTAFEVGVPAPYTNYSTAGKKYKIYDRKEIFLPWELFNGNESKLFAITPKALKMAEEFHPAWNKLTAQGKLLHARNSHQLFGRNMDKPVKCVVCWTPGGKGGGGTGQAIRIANAHGIPVFDMATYGIDYIRQQVVALEQQG